MQTSHILHTASLLVYNSLTYVYVLKKKNSEPSETREIWYM